MEDESSAGSIVEGLKKSEEKTNIKSDIDLIIQIDIIDVINRLIFKDKLNVFLINIDNIDINPKYIGINNEYNLKEVSYCDLILL